MANPVNPGSEISKFIVDDTYMVETVAEPEISGDSVVKTVLIKEHEIVLPPVTNQNAETSAADGLKRSEEEKSSTTSEIVNADQEYAPKLDDGIDDETTLDDEEQNGIADEEELDELRTLQEMPLEELLKMYGGAAAARSKPPAEETVETEYTQEELEASDQAPQTSHAATASHGDETVAGESFADEEDGSSSDEEDEDAANPDDEIGAEMGRNDLLKFLSRLRSHGVENEGEEDDSSSGDDEEFVPFRLLMLKREIPMGPAHQVETPDVDVFYDENVSEPSDQVLQWSPHLPESIVREYLKSAYVQERELLKQEIDPAQLDQTDVADDEEFLKELLDCNYDTNEALRRCRRNFRPGRYESSKWSEKECEDFEAAIVDNWKRFNIVQTAVPTRTVKEVVDFYYRWKKSNRFEVFLAKIRLPDGKPHEHLEEKIRVRIGKKRAFDAMDAVAENNLSIPEASGSGESKTKAARLETTRDELPSLPTDSEQDKKNADQ
ncbi:mesoderm induction early response protein 1-like [Paramacrobiotus metropolitanus]|uniref:mesoderm induction early response protein 1-like n=1 Tax=Paramacrobiotus metropolitanus TaxID=2943436 RepID=UPI0024465987|nr:mesoderm induction early response protein 1-like [Paramacrobiotus metropolitanus]XP_055351736.1 mesoderm induction early response protein 1-like [Paramacrobiotus metropolitanus]